MPENHSRHRKRVERMRVKEDHDRRTKAHPVLDEEVDPPYIPVLKRSNRGKIVEKDITNYIIKCPECFVKTRYDEDELPICPECGMVCAGDSMKKEERIIRDAKAAGRIDDDDRTAVSYP